MFGDTGFLLTCANTQRDPAGLHWRGSDLSGGEESLSCCWGTGAAQVWAVRAPCQSGSVREGWPCRSLSPGVPLGVHCLLPWALHLSAPTPFPRLLNPRPPRPRGHLQVHGGQLHPDPGGGHLHDGRGDSWAPNSGTNFPAPPVTLRQLQPWLGGKPREANSRGHVTAAGC